MSVGFTRILVLGGTKSGKTAHAEALALRLSHQHNQRVAYFATAIANDTELQARIDQHRTDRANDARKADWVTVETGKRLVEALSDISYQNHIVLVDCLTLWITAWLVKTPEQLASELEQFLRVFAARKSPTILVSNENSLGITPMGDLSRKYLDIVGKFHQDVANVSDLVNVVMAGLPLSLKPPTTPMVV